MRHELRTPINHILGYCEMLMEEEQFPKAHAEDLRRITRAAGNCRFDRAVFRRRTILSAA